MEREPIDYSTLAFRVYEEESKRMPKGELPLDHYLMQIISALGRVAATNCDSLLGTFIDYKLFNSDIIGPNGFNESYNKHIKGSLQDKLAEVAIRIFILIGARGIKVSMFDNMSLNSTSLKPYISNWQKSLSEFIYELVATLTHRKENDCLTLELLRSYEAKPEDAELIKLLDEHFGPIEEPEDVELRTVSGFQNYMVTMPLMTVLNVIASWFDYIGGHDMVWHISARMYYKSNL